MQFLVDYRERGVLEIVGDVLGDYEMTNLPVGDFFLISGYGVLLERKSASDFLSSMRTNRLWDQLERMLVPRVNGVEVRRRGLILHGCLDDVLEESGFGWNHVSGALMEIQYRYGIPVFHVESDDALREFFRILVKREMEGKNEGEIERRWYRESPRRGMSEEEWKIYTLASLPYVGEKLAKKLLERFGSIEGVARASVGELKRVEGIGEKKARIIHRILH